MLMNGMFLKNTEKTSQQNKITHSIAHSNTVSLFKRSFKGLKVFVFKDEYYTELYFLASLWDVMIQGTRLVKEHQIQD